MSKREIQHVDWRGRSADHCGSSCRSGTIADWSPVGGSWRRRLLPRRSDQQKSH